MRTKYLLVDAEGDVMDTRLFSTHVDIPVKVRSVEFRKDFDHDQEPDLMIITLEYLHGK